jgi:hypothetical protein
MLSSSSKEEMKYHYTKEHAHNEDFKLYLASLVTRIIQSLYYAPAGRYIKHADRGRSIIRVTERSPCSISIKRVSYLNNNIWIKINKNVKNVCVIS